jgi:hypothetical protein
LQALPFRQAALPAAEQAAVLVSNPEIQDNLCGITAPQMVALYGRRAYGRKTFTLRVVDNAEAGYLFSFIPVISLQNK